jgi:hypothetical protein
VKRRSRSKKERIKVKMRRSLSSGWGRTKKVRGGTSGSGKGSIDEIYTPVFRARAGSTKCIFFFLD